jgi:predicted RNA-binding Zn-ribbon protein involved in translation (DUF1610 family)
MKKYHAVHFCKACGERLSYTEVMYSHGVCPYCGACSGSTVVGRITRGVARARGMFKEPTTLPNPTFSWHGWPTEIAIGAFTVVIATVVGTAAGLIVFWLWGAWI